MSLGWCLERDALLRSLGERIEVVYLSHHPCLGTPLWPCLGCHVLACLSATTEVFHCRL